MEMKILMRQRLSGVLSLVVKNKIFGGLFLILFENKK